MRKFAENFGDEDDEIVVADDLRIRGNTTTTAEVKRLKMTTTTTKKTTKKKVSVSVSPYNVYELRIRRLRSNSALHRNDTTTFQDDTVVSTSCVDDDSDEVVAVNFSSNFASSSSSSSCSSEFLKNCDNSTTTTPEIVADLEVDSGAEMSSKFVDCNKSARKIETSKIDEPETNRLDHPTKSSTVEIKSTTTTMPSESEIEDFFSSAEKDLQKRFSDKYNYDIVKDVPLEGRYEWVQITP